VCSGADLNRDLIEMELHGFAVAGWQHLRGSRPKLGTDRTEQIGRLGALIVNGARARALSAELLVLRRQLNVLRRKFPGRLAFSSIERWLLPACTRWLTIFSTR
jgi:hypothetical protein